MKKLLFKTKNLTATLLLGLLGISSTVWAVSNPAPVGGVPIESSLAVANVTSGDHKYHDSINAKVDEVVKFEVWYHNPEPAGTDKIAKNLNVKINIPTTSGKTHTASSSVGGSNTNTETDIAAVKTEIDTTLQFIPGTAYRRHNIGTDAAPKIVTEKISDSVVSGGYTIPELKPCWNFQETITVQARVMAPVFKLNKFVKLEGASKWETTVNAKPGDKVAYLLVVENVSNVRLTNMILQDSFPTKLEYVKGSAKLYNTNYPNGYAISDNLIVGGANIGNLAPGVNGQVRFNAIVPKTLPEACYDFKNVVNAKADQTGWVHNQANVKSCYAKGVTPPKEEKPTPTPIPTAEAAPTTLPVSGPADVAGILFGGMSFAGSLASYRKSKKNLKKAFLK